MPDNPAPYFEVVQVAAGCDSLITSRELDEILTRMLKPRQGDAFEDEERGTVYVRHC